MAFLPYSSAKAATPNARTAERADDDVTSPATRGPALVVCWAGRLLSVPDAAAPASVPDEPLELSEEPEDDDEPLLLLLLPPPAVPLPDCADGIWPGDRFSAAAAASCL